MTNTPPEWVSTKLNLPIEKIACLMVDTTSEDNYSAFLDYLGHRGVNIGEPPAKHPDTTEKPPSVTEKILNARECEGELSTLLLDQRTCTEYARVLFGIGNAHIRHEGDDVYAVHAEIGGPVGTSDYGAHVYRRLNLYAKNAEVLRSLSNTVVKWNHERQQRQVNKEEGKFDLYILKFYQENDTPEWECKSTKTSRSLDSVILPSAMRETIVKDVREFNSPDTREWYAKRGLPYRRSFLFHGKPGTGKTSLIRALAGALGLSACFLSLGDRRIGNPELQSVLSDLPEKALLVIEDVDALFNEKRKSDNPSPLTFSSLLNAMDGLISEDGTLTIMTTNHIERLDPALIRAGRVDRKFEFKPPSREMMAQFFKSFYPEADDKIAEEFANLAVARPEVEARSLATLQEHFIYTRGKTAKECVGLLDEFFTEFYPRIVESKELINTAKEAEKTATQENSMDESNEGSDDDDDGNTRAKKRKRTARSAPKS